MGSSAKICNALQRTVVYGIVVLLLVSSIFTLGDDLGAMGESAYMLLGGPAWIYLLVMGLVSILLQVFVPYSRYVKYLKFLAFSLLAYVVTAFVVRIDWRAALLATVLPPVQLFHGAYLTVVVAVPGRVRGRLAPVLAGGCDARGELRLDEEGRVAIDLLE